MRKAFRIAAIVVASLIVLLVGLLFAAPTLSEHKRARVIDIRVAPVAYAQGDAAIARGKYLYESRGCMECHGDNGGGRDVINDPSGFYVKSPNISPGAGSVVADYTEADWVRAIRHGVSRAGHPLIVMPSKDYSRLTDEDLAALVAYVRGLPPANGSAAEIRFPLIVKALYAFGIVKDDAERIDHTRPPPAPVAEGVSQAHGQYVAAMCTGCHGDGLSGGKIPGSPPDWPPAANLTPGEGSALPRYRDVEQFKSMLRTGKRPDGSPVSAVMPFASLKNMSDVDIAAVYLYLRSLPPQAAGRR